MVGQTACSQNAAPEDDEPDGEELSHEQMWAAIPTAIIRDCSSKAKPAPGLVCTVVESDTDSEDGSSSCPVDESDRFWDDCIQERIGNVAVAPQCPSGDSLTDGDLSDDIPTIEQMRLQGEALQSRRSAIQAMAARYLPPARGAQISPPRTVATARSSSNARGDDPHRVGDGPPGENRLEESASDVGQPVVAAGSSHSPDSKSTDAVERAEAVPRILGGNIPSTKPERHCKELAQPVASRVHGPRATPDKAKASAVLREIGDRFRQKGLVTTGSNVQGNLRNVDIINILGERLGELSNRHIDAPSQDKTSAESRLSERCGEDADVGAKDEGTNVPKHQQRPSPAQRKPQSNPPARAQATIQNDGPARSESGGAHSADKLTPACAENDPGLWADLLSDWFGKKEKPVGCDFVPPPNEYYASSTS